MSFQSKVTEANALEWIWYGVLVTRSTEYDRGGRVLSLGHLPLLLVHEVAILCMFHIPNIQSYTHSSTPCTEYGAWPASLLNLRNIFSKDPMQATKCPRLGIATV